MLHTSDRALDISRLALTVQEAPWHLAPGSAPHIEWGEGRVTVRDLTLTDQATGGQRIAISGGWSNDEQAALRIVASDVYIDTLSGAMAQPARYGGRLDADATIRGATEAARPS